MSRANTNTAPPTLVGLTKADFEALFAERGEPKYRSKQLFDALYRRRIPNLDEITDLPKGLRERLASDHLATTTTVKSVFTSTDGTRRYLLALGDGQDVEAVFIPEPRRDTICISSQVGCAVGCTFCMTAQMPVRRQMTAGEIVSQVLVVLNEVYGPGAEVPHGTNIVFMGMGEPFLNYDEVLAAVRLLAHPAGIGIAPRRMTVSTSGVVPRIYDLAKEAVRPELAISLSAPNDELREQLVPINRKYPIADRARLPRIPGPRERLTFEYVMLDGVNDTDELAHELVRLAKGLKVKVNLIPHNPAPELPYHASPHARIQAFQQVLREGGVDAFIRRPRGQDVAAACGQLAARQTASPGE